MSFPVVMRTNRDIKELLECLMRLAEKTMKNKKKKLTVVLKTTIIGDITVSKALNGT